MTPPPRSRQRLESGWRFQRIAPDQVDHALDYIPWPELGAAEDGKDADARPEQVRHDAADTGLRPWILPTASPFVHDPSARAERPEGAPPVRPRAADPGTDDADWQQVTVPHDWAIAGPFLVEGPHGGMGRLESWGVGWYRRDLEILAEDTGRSIHLEIDGAMSYASVWLNGTLVGGWPYGYTSWRLDLTPHVRPGERNLLAIRLDNPPRSARWYPGGGLFRDVHLVRTAPVAVGHWGTTITTHEVSEDSADVDVEVRLVNAGSQPVAVQVETEIHTIPDGSGMPGTGSPAGTLVATTGPGTADVGPGAEATLSGSASIQRPALWGPPPTQRPHRHLAVTTVRQGGEVVDQVRTPFGVRRIEFDADEGLLVNGERIRIQGVNNHHDLGSLGAAFHERAAERQLEILQEMGANALRTAHNPPAPELLDLTDRMGILVLDEVFDSWYARKTDLDFHLIFEDWHEADLRAMIRRDRHHPSVILWGIGNEVGEQYTEEEGALVARRLVEIAHQEDPSRLTTTAMNYAKPHMPLPAEVDVIGINYQGEGIRQEPIFEGTDRIRTPPQYPLFREAFPRTPMLGTETASALSTRGTYLFPVAEEQSGPARDGRGADDASCTVSAYELHAVDFGSTAEKVFASLESHPYVAGEFVWTGFDYLGEPTPYYSARSSYTGIVDLAGFPKDRFWLYRSQWRPEVPTAHLLPHWTWPGREGEVTPVHVFTSGDEAELFVDGVSQGRRRKQPGQFRLRWDETVYTPGEVRVQVYRDGAPWAEDVVRTAGAPAHLELTADRSAITADGRDLVHVSARVLDADGVEVPTATDLLRFAVEGPGRILATDNGDPTDMTAFPSPERRAFSGRALAVVAAERGADGTLRVSASAEGLQGDEVLVQLARSPRPGGRTAGTGAGER
ncbi:beta-galactosidase [Brachybacterium ginsengisoli]|uniref:Beta-galactosidase n=1 Tax=Brachybacterium ginsengisoli TaxID=1331682 RepID=A0A291H160_9MICO|nr:beta-galactosidase GalB [Brachybacterium ginsengisoli]ATG56201.1 beta-galactosidase [Brachybacterium ginsengisoli]